MSWNVCHAGYYAVDAKAETAMDGVWKKGPGVDLFSALEKVSASLTSPSSLCLSVAGAVCSAGIVSDPISAPTWGAAEDWYLKPNTSEACSFSNGHYQQEVSFQCIISCLSIQEPDRVCLATCRSWAMCRS